MEKYTGFDLYERLAPDAEPEPVHWYRGEIATDRALLHGLIKLSQLEDPPEMKPFLDRGITHENWLRHLDELTDEEITFLLNMEPGLERLNEERKAEKNISDRTRAEFLRDF